MTEREHLHMRSNTSSPLPYAAVTATTDNILSLDGKPYLNYINSIKSPATQKTYIFSLKRYMRFHKYKTIEELLADKNTPYNNRRENHRLYCRIKNRLRFCSLI
jgi:hypothetical protein